MKHSLPARVSGVIFFQEILQAALRPRGQRAKAHRVGEDVFCVLVEGLLLALSDKTSSQYFRRKGVALEGEFDGISYFDDLREELGCHLSGFAFLMYARAACFIRYFLILSFVPFTQYLLFSAFAQHSEVNDVCELSLPISNVVTLLLDCSLGG